MAFISPTEKEIQYCYEYLINAVWTRTAGKNAIHSYRLKHILEEEYIDKYIPEEAVIAAVNKIKGEKFPHPLPTRKAKEGNGIFIGLHRINFKSCKNPLSV